MSEKTWFKIVNKGAECTELAIYDEISSWGVSAKSFVSALNGIKTKNITLRINSPGGSVFDGFAIFNAIQEHPATVAVRVDGVAASIASVIALAGDTVSVAKNAFMMIHNPMVMAFGSASEIRKEADLLDKLRDKIADAYAAKSGKPLDQIKKAMDEETWFDASECKAFGLCDSIAGDDDEDDDDYDASALAETAIAAALKYTKLPDRLKKIAASLTHPRKETTVTPMIVARDGKHFVTIDGKEHEIQVLTVTAPVNAAPAAAIPATVDVEAIKAQAIKEEREYATAFNAAVASANLAGKALEDFKAFYGRPIADVKWLASNAIASRTQPVGEGSGAPEGSQKTEAQKIEEEAGKRFASESKVRELWGVRTNDASDAAYKHGLSRYVRAEAKYAADQKAQATATPAK